MNAAKGKVIAFGGEDGTMYNIEIQGMRMEQLHKFKYLGVYGK